MQERNKELSIYVHIPFCVRKCLYCDFLSFNAGENMIEEYFTALGKEITLSAKQYTEFDVKSIFFGGGTPSFPDAKYICRILETILGSFNVREAAEISIEANPASAMFDKLKAYREAGFNRISIGAQSLNDEELKKIGRVHDSRMFLETFDNARKAGFENINIDVMSALPDQSFDSYMETLTKVVELKPEHISAYSLIVEEETPFYDMELNLPDEDTDRRMYHETKRFLAEKGYHRYEISNYALNPQIINDDYREAAQETENADVCDESYEKYECRHNKVYWTRGNYLGLGLGASSMVENVRWKNTSSVRDYERILLEGESDSNDESEIKTDCFDNPRQDEQKILNNLRQDEQILSTEDQMEEYMFLGLRLVKGVSISGFKEKFSQDISDVYGTIIEKYISEGLLQISGDYLSLTDEGLDVSNTVMADFLLDD